MHSKTGNGIRVEANCKFLLFRMSTKITQKPNQCVILERLKNVTTLLIAKPVWCPLNATHILRVGLWFSSRWENNNWTQPSSKTNWPFSMENMSCRWGDGGVPAYLPPLFLRKKQAMRAMRVRSATAHMVPMNQPWVENSLCCPPTPENKNKSSTETQSSKFHFTSRCIWARQSPRALPKQLFIWLREKNMMDSRLRGCSHVLFDSYSLQLKHSLSSKHIRQQH